MKKVVLMLVFTVSIGLMSFTNKESNNVKMIKKNSVELNSTDQVYVDVCYRTCRYAVNRRTGSRRLLGCSDWDCGSLPGFEL